jgi:Putative addiction module component
MAPRTAKVVAEGLKLPPDERAQVIDELLRSLDEGDDLEDDDRARLHAALRESDEEFKAGLGIPAADVLARLRPR